jgi:iron complex outermembrane receptor protein
MDGHEQHAFSKGGVHMHSGLIRFAVRRALLGGLVAMTAAQAQAQIVETQAGGLEEVIVTARKVRENLQDTPIAISAFSGDALVDRQVFRTTSSTRRSKPAVRRQRAARGNNSSSQVFIRGIGQTDPTSTVDPGGLYIDDGYRHRRQGHARAAGYRIGAGSTRSGRELCSDATQSAVRS